MGESVRVCVCVQVSLCVCLSLSEKLSPNLFNSAALFLSVSAFKQFQHKLKFTASAKCSAGNLSKVDLMVGAAALWQASVETETELSLIVFVFQSLLSL